MANHISTSECAEETVSGLERETGAFEALWKLFSSMRTAITLLLVLAAASVVGTVIPQKGMPQDYAGAYGMARYALLRGLGLTDVYHSGWYELVLALLGVNLFVCSINRFKITWRRTRQPEVCVDSASIANMRRPEKLFSHNTVKDTADKIGTTLRRGLYRVRRESEGDDVVLHAARGSISLWGPFLTHLSILVIFVGAIVGGALGWEGYTTITEGKSTETYYRQGADDRSDLGFRVALRKFSIGYDEQHNPTAYRSDLRVYRGADLVAQKVIDVNHPLTYRGVSFHQTDYGLSGLTLKVTAPNGESVRVPFDIETGNGSNGKVYSISGEPFKQVKIGGKKLTIFVHDFVPDYAAGHQAGMSFLPINPAASVMVNDRFPEYKGLDAWSKLGWLALSKSNSYKGFAITLDDVVDYTGLGVSRNPGLPIIYTGFGLLLIAVFLAFYVSHMVIRVRISPSKGGAAVTAGAASRLEDSSFDRDFARIRGVLTAKNQI